jgi:hypothetical protein
MYHEHFHAMKCSKQKFLEDYGDLVPHARQDAGSLELWVRPENIVRREWLELYHAEDKTPS